MAELMYTFLTYMSSKSYKNFLNNPFKDVGVLVLREPDRLHRSLPVGRSGPAHLPSDNSGDYGGLVRPDKNV